MSPLPQSLFISVPSQAERLAERRTAAAPTTKICHGEEILVLPGVYGTSVDTELMIDSVEVSSNETFLEIGTGTGAISIALAQCAQSGLGVDINPRAVKNSQQNAERAHTSNVTFAVSDLFQSVQGTFDVIVFNPPYGDQLVKDEIDRMFWDPNNETKRAFFEQVNTHLNPNGRIYFGWANFADIDVDLPLHLAEQHQLQICRTFLRDARTKEFQFIVFEMGRAR